MPMVSFEDGRVQVGGRELPGLLSRMEISCDVKFDEAESDQLSGKIKTPMGFEDATVDVELELLTDDDDEAGGGAGTSCYDKARELNAIFKGLGSNAEPQIFDVVSTHLQARGIDQVVFSHLSTVETSDDDLIVARVTFTEHNPAVAEEERRVVAADKGKAGAATGASAGTAPALTPPNEPAPRVDLDLA